MIEAEKVSNFDVSLDQFFFTDGEFTFFIQAGGGGLSCNQLYKQKFYTNVRRKFQL